MRTFFAQVETRYRAIKNRPFTPAHVTIIMTYEKEIRLRPITGRNI